MAWVVTAHPTQGLAWRLQLRILLLHRLQGSCDG